MALPATGAQISMSTVRTFFNGQGGIPGSNSNLLLSATFGAFINPSVTTNTKLSATFGGWQNGNSTGASP
tara:strand:- start:6635 stop:6844 length:210 start_codon:yes stop_codon:yes gene_type:complete